MARTRTHSNRKSQPSSPLTTSTNYSDAGAPDPAGYQRAGVVDGIEQAPDAQAPADGKGGDAERVEEVLDGGPKSLRRARHPRCAVPVGLGQPDQMVPFLLGQAQSAEAAPRAAGRARRRSYEGRPMSSGLSRALRDRRSSLSSARRSVRQTPCRRPLHVKTSTRCVLRLWERSHMPLQQEYLRRCCAVHPRRAPRT